MMSSSKIDLTISPIRHCFIYFKAILLDEYKLELLHCAGKLNNISYCGYLVKAFLYVICYFLSDINIVTLNSIGC